MRIATSHDISDGLFDVRYRWSFRDLLEAHHALDAIEEIRETLQPDPG